MSKARDFKDSAELRIVLIQQLIDEMPHKGDKEDQSQKMVLQNRLDSLSRAVAGVTDEDFKIE